MNIRSHIRQETVVLLLAVAIFIASSIFLNGFIEASNIVTLVRGVALLGILAIGMGIVVIGRGIDLSVVSILAISVACMLQLLNMSYSLPSALAITLAGVIVMGGINGFLVAYAEVPAIFATLASGTFVYGIGRSQWLSGDVVYMPDNQTGFMAMGELKFLGIPAEIYFFLGIAFLAFLALRFTRPGRFIYFMGDNFAAARNMGIPVRPVIVLQYIVSALIAFVAGVIMAASLHSMNTRIVNSTLLYDIILVVVIGGIGLSGGKGGIRNVIVGTLLIGILLNAMTILDIPDLYQKLIKASFLLVALIADGFINPRDEQTDQAGDI
ncbi:MAG: ABC transporter permease [Parvibaculaceae bacterium]|nr:ABC transporter permease [Parvibaculaceae bacterium]